MKRHQIFLTRLFLISSIIGTWLLGGYLLEIRPLAVQPTPLPLPTQVTFQEISATPEAVPQTDSYRLQLNADLQVYNSRLGGLQPTRDDLMLVFSENISSARLSQQHLRARWEIALVFPWPITPTAESQPFSFRETLDDFNWPITGQGGAILREYAVRPEVYFLDAELRNRRYSGECSHFVEGYVLFSSITPVIGEFQFFCQFDSTDYAQVSGRFWQ